MKKNWLLLVAFMNVLSLSGQNYIIESKLPKVANDGFYRVLLEPSLTSYLNSDFSNIRFYDSDNKETAYFLKFEIPLLYNTTFKEYEIVEKVVLKDSATILTISNPGQNTIDNISLLIKNARVTKEASLYGSDDNINWYILRDHLYLSDIENASNTSELKIVDFPLSNYKYYQLRISDKNTGPVNILKAGYYSNGREFGTYMDVPIKSFSQTENQTEKVSHIRIKFDTTHFIDRLQWRIKGQKFYKRNVVAYSVQQRITKRGKVSTYLDYLGALNLQTGDPTLLQISGIKVKELLLVVQNNDNQPLTFEEMKAFQLRRFATLWLARDKQYVVRIGNPGMAAPVYDIEYFRDSVPASANIITPQGLELLHKEEDAKEESFFTTKWFIWGALIAVMLFLGVMSIKMVRETGAVEKS
jgi:hypothetical protein